MVELNPIIQSFAPESYAPERREIFLKHVSNCFNILEMKRTAQKPPRMTVELLDRAAAFMNKIVATVSRYKQQQQANNAAIPSQKQYTVQAGQGEVYTKHFQKNLTTGRGRSSREREEMTLIFPTEVTALMLGVNYATNSCLTYQFTNSTSLKNISARRHVLSSILLTCLSERRSTAPFFRQTCHNKMTK